MRSTEREKRLATLLAVATLALAGCAQKGKPPMPPPVAERPPPLRPPGPHGDGGLRALNWNLSADEAAWHLRAALNVAALSCDRSGKLGIAASYNQLLARQRVPLAAAYRSEGARFAGAGALDAHMTRLYNLFAQPPAQARFCIAASQIAAEAPFVPPNRFAAYASGALERLIAPSDNHPAPAVQPAMKAAAGPPWRIQLGAYSGDGAARGAWERIRRRMKGAADFVPRYEDVPGSALVRIRVGPVSDRSQAIAICAAAAGAGLDCLPVPPST